MLAGSKWFIRIKELQQILTHTMMNKIESKL